MIILIAFALGFIAAKIPAEWWIALWGLIKEATAKVWAAIKERFAKLKDMRGK